MVNDWSKLVDSLFSGLGGGQRLFPLEGGRVTLSSDADFRYSVFYQIMESYKENAKCDYVASLYSKMQIQALRLALVLHGIEVAQKEGKHPSPHTLEKHTMEQAVKCMDYFEDMAMRVFFELTAKSPSAMRKITSAELIKAIREKNPAIAPVEIGALLGVSRQNVERVLK